MLTRVAAVWSEGSLLRRTLLSIGTFVLGSVVFLALCSLVLTSVAKGLLPDHSEASDASTSSKSKTEASEDGGAASGAKTPGGLKGSRSKRKPTAPPPSEDTAGKDE